MLRILSEIHLNIIIYISPSHVENSRNRNRIPKCAHIGAELKVPSVENLELLKILFLSLEYVRIYAAICFKYCQKSNLNIYIFHAC